MKINGLEIPSQLAIDLESGGRKLTPDEMLRLKNLLTYVEAPLPKLYGREYVEECNQLWGSKSEKHYLGTRSDSILPGNIDPKYTLIIGEAEPDSPIALDYRTGDPRVIYLGDIDHCPYWIELTNDYPRLISALHETV